MRIVKFLAAAAIAASALLPSLAGAAEKLKVGIMGGDLETIWAVVKKNAAEKGLEVELVVFSDWTLPNNALNAGEIDANAFQHVPYLDTQKKQRGYDIVPVGYTFVTPMGIYSRKVKSLGELKDGASIGVPNDPTNGGRALLLLQAQKLIKLKEGTGLTPTPLDIAENPRKLRIREIDAAQLPRSLDDLDAAVINTTYARPANLFPERDAIAIESAQDNPYANVIAVRSQDKDKPWVKPLVAAFQSDSVKQLFAGEFKGAYLAAW